MARTVIGVFNTYGEAENAWRELVNRGLRGEDVSVVATETTRGEGSALAAEETENLATGAGTGAAVGGAAGMILGIAALAIPGIGPIVAAGPLAAALAGAGLGAAAGGLIGGLAKMGVPAEQAQRYEDAVRRGGTLIAVHAQEADVDGVESILNRHGAIDVEQLSEHADTGEENARRRAADPHNQARTFAQEAARPHAGVPSTNLSTGRSDVRFYDPDRSVAPDLSDSSVREMYERDWKAHHTWEDFSDAWRFGHGLAIHERYGSAGWPDVEADARRHWESDRPHGWVKAKDIVRRAWEHVRGRE